MRAGSVHPQWHLKRDGRKIGGGPRRVEPLPFPPLGSERACRWGPRGLHCGEGTCTRVHRVDGAPACRQKVYFRTVYVTFATPCLTFPCLYVRSSAQHGILPGPSSHFPCVSGVVGCVPNQDRKVGRQFFFHLVQVNGPHHLRGSVRMGSSNEQATVGLSGFRSCRPRQSPIPFFPPVVPSCWVSPKISALPCLSIHALLLPETTEIVWFSLFFLCPPPHNATCNKKANCMYGRQI